MLALPMLRQKMRATAESKSEWRTADGCDPTPRASLTASEPVVEQGMRAFPNAQTLGPPAPPRCCHVGHS